MDGIDDISFIDRERLKGEGERGDGFLVYQYKREREKLHSWGFIRGSSLDTTGL
jgi:hypothetical protein